MSIIDVKLSTQREREKEREVSAIHVPTCTVGTLGRDCDVVAFSWYFMLSYTFVLSSFSYF